MIVDIIPIGVFLSIVVGLFGFGFILGSIINNEPTNGHFINNMGRFKVGCMMFFPSILTLILIYIFEGV